MSYMPKSKSDDYITPQTVYNTIEKVFDYNPVTLFDPCPLFPEEDGLKINWKDFNFVNPPYSLLKEFVQKAIDESWKKHITIMLLPSKTDQEWFSKLIHLGYKIHWFTGRLKFDNEKHHATQPHFLVLIK